MALKPSYNDKLHLPGLSKTEILILALEASQKLEWNIEEVTPEGADSKSRSICILMERK